MSIIVKRKASYKYIQEVNFNSVFLRFKILYSILYLKLYENFFQTNLYCLTCIYKTKLGGNTQKVTSLITK